VFALAFSFDISISTFKWKRYEKMAPKGKLLAVRHGSCEGKNPARVEQRVDIQLRAAASRPGGDCTVGGAFIEMWPDLAALEAEREELATGAFTDTVTTFSEFADDETLRLVPGHACFLDPRPDKDREGRTRRVAHRMKFELLPLLRV
jgi:hypothetical protein